MYVIFSQDSDPAMRYEGLARTAFDCKKWEGPDNLASQEYYNNHFVPEADKKAIKALKKILKELESFTSGDTKKDLKNVRKSISLEIGQRGSIGLIDYVIKIVEDY
jgi:hypothetical protein